jgi:hypothetical protein
MQCHRLEIKKKEERRLDMEEPMQCHCLEVKYIYKKRKEEREEDSC